MEGACGRIVDTEVPTVIIKQVFRKGGKQRSTKSHRAFMQCQIQQKVGSLLEELGSTLLFVPKAWSPQEHQYTMERIDVSRPVQAVDIENDAALQKELSALYQATYNVGLFPCDYELYRQVDGRIGMIDFDKFGRWNRDGSVEFPFGLCLTGEQAREHTILPVPLSFPYKN